MFLYFRLWVPPSSRTMIEKNNFDKKFSPFFRVTQIIATPKNKSIENIIKKESILELWYLQNKIRQIKVENKTIDNICFTPMPDKGCMVDSVTEFWQDDLNKIENEENVQSRIFDCL